MRPGLLLAALLSALPVAAHAAGDRYGDRPESVRTASAAYEGPLLSWSRKVDPAPEPVRMAERTAYQPFQPQTPLPLQWSAPKAPLPATIYDAPTPQPPVQKVAARNLVASSPVLLGGPPATPQAAQRTGGATRLYSVHRSYGLEPDAIPQQPGGDRYVLIGPPDSGVQPLSTPDDDAQADGPGDF